ncbi:hypothetical protein P7K49_006180 [Saguinus oedipus]|uniref:Uncharacterized protein n=1 Tax=Saguinus oedipus TaxID=9490 RepID=A0ABQ9W3A2_SAGOE|nr:hypothetical protein P7K49_006180 [Saguinus oedipus]
MQALKIELQDRNKTQVLKDPAVADDTRQGSGRPYGQHICIDADDSSWLSCWLEEKIGYYLTASSPSSGYMCQCLSLLSERNTVVPLSSPYELCALPLHSTPAVYQL